MYSEQGAGGSFERRRNLSSAGAAGEGEPMKEGEVQVQQPVQDDATAQSEGPSISTKVSPRRFDAASRTPPADPSYLSRQSSAASQRSTNPATPSERSTLPHHTMRRWPVEPPVTKSTLGELDVVKIIHNPKLRHDVNFDPELHFRPNLEGEKGRKKLLRANHFWESLLKELTEFAMDRDAFFAKHGHRNDWTLPALLKAVKEIIQTLVPQRDRPLLDDGLNIELLMQQFYKGMADLEKLASWLARVLKSHCAPMRDEWVDKMYTHLSMGNSMNCLKTLVEGMRDLLNVLEAMKLDVANHQIRCLRPVLIEDTVHYEQKFFYKKLQSGKLDLSGSRQWYRAAEKLYNGETVNFSQSFGEMTVFFHGLAQLSLPPPSDKHLPSTFMFDEDRLQKARADLLDVINLEICMFLYQNLEPLARSAATSELSRPAVMERGSNRSSQHSDDFDFNTPPSSSRPSSLVLSSAGSPPCSPRSSLAVPSYLAQDDTDHKGCAQELYGSLRDLLQSEPVSTSRPAARWQALASSMALQIFRFTPQAPKDLYQALENSLMNSVCNPESQLYREMEHKVLNKLVFALAKRVRDFKPLSGHALFQAATSTKGHVAGQDGRDRDGDAIMSDSHDELTIDDVARRLAHIGILHWRVWADLAYVDDLGDMSPELEQSTVPLATTVDSISMRESQGLAVAA